MQDDFEVIDIENLSDEALDDIVGGSGVHVMAKCA